MKIRDFTGKLLGLGRYLCRVMHLSPPTPQVSKKLQRVHRSMVWAVAFVTLWYAGHPFAAHALQRSAAELSRVEALSYFLLNCAYFGRWQGERDPQASKVIRIGVLGRDPLGRTLDEVAAKAREAWFSDGRILIERSDDPARLKDCLVVFVSATESGNLREIFSALKHDPILLVSEIPDFAQWGGTIEVRIREERLQFDINLEQLAAKRIEISSKMKKRAAAFIQQGKRTPNTFSEGGDR